MEPSTMELDKSVKSEPEQQENMLVNCEASSIVKTENLEDEEDPIGPSSSSNYNAPHSSNAESESKPRVLCAVIRRSVQNKFKSFKLDIYPHETKSGWIKVGMRCKKFRTYVLTLYPDAVVEMEPLDIPMVGYVATGGGIMNYKYAKLHLTVGCKFLMSLKLTYFFKNHQNEVLKVYMTKITRN